MTSLASCKLTSGVMEDKYCDEDLADVLLACTPSFNWINPKLIYMNKGVYKWTRSKGTSPTFPVKVICRLKQGMYAYVFHVTTWHMVNIYRYVMHKFTFAFS